MNGQHGAAKPKTHQDAQVPRSSKRDKLVVMADVWLRPTPEGPADKQMLVFNISLGGVGLRSNSSLNKDTIAFICFTAGPIHLESKVRVCWSRSREGMGYEIGCEFLTPEGKPLVERAPKPTTDEAAKKGK
jgi:hypothetical protein